MSMALLIVSRQIKYTYVQHVLINQNWPWSLFCFIVARVSISHIIHVFTKSKLAKKSNFKYFRSMFKNFPIVGRFRIFHFAEKKWAKS